MTTAHQFLLAVFLCGLCSLPLLAEEVHYPADAVINLTQAPYNLDPTGVEDCQPALQQAFDDHAGTITTRRILYLPHGTYRLSARVQLNTHSTNNGGNGRGIILQGQSCDGSILRLDNNAVGFGDADSPQAVIDFNQAEDFSGWQYVGFHTHLRHLTVTVGAGNPGAIGVDFCANNAGGLRQVRIVSEDPQRLGWAGLRLSPIPGPQLLTQVEIVGFEWSIRTHASANYTTTAEHLLLREARSGGIRNNRHSFTIRDLRTENLGGPAIHNIHADGLITLIEGELHGGLSESSAMVNDGFAFVRDLNTSGYARAMTTRAGVQVEGTSLAEWTSDAVSGLWDDAPSASLRLPIRETPTIAVDPPQRWVSVRDFGAIPGDYANDSGPINNAIAAMTAESGEHAGKTTLYLPVAGSGADEGRYDIDATIVIPPGIERIVGCYSVLFPRGVMDPDNPQPVLRIIGSGPPLVIEQLFTGANDQAKPAPIILNESDRVIILRDVLILEGQAYVNAANSTAPLYLENVAATSLRYWGGDPQPVPGTIPQFDFGPQPVWARQLNPEGKDANLGSNGGRLWVLGMKNEEDGSQMVLRGGARAELLGGVLMPLDVDVGSDPAYVVEESEFFAVIAGHMRATLPTPHEEHAPLHEILVRETHNEVTRSLTDADYPLRRTYSNNLGYRPPVLFYRSPALPLKRSIYLQLRQGEQLPAVLFHHHQHESILNTDPMSGFHDLDILLPQLIEISADLDSEG